MKKIMSLIAVTMSLQIFTVPAGCIINRSGQTATVNYLKSDGTALFSTGAISLNGNADHSSDQMIIIPLTTVENPNSTTNPKANYQASATSANVVIGNTTVNIPSFAANTSYVIAPGTTAGTFIANAGLITYDTITGAATPGNPSPVAPGAGF